MSSYIVEPKLIAGLLTLAAPEKESVFVWAGVDGTRYALGDGSPIAYVPGARVVFTRDALGTELLRVCRAAVATRYRTVDPDDPGLPGSQTTAFEFARVWITPIEGLRLAEEYEAQVSGDPAYHGSVVFTFIAALRRVLVGRLPQFEILDPPHLPMVQRMFRAAAGRRLYDVLAPLFVDPDAPVNGCDVVELVGWVLETERVRLASQLGARPAELPV